MCFHNPEYTCSSLTLRLWGLLWLTSEYTPSPCTRGTWLESSSDLSQASQGGRNGAVLHHTAGTGLQSGLAPTSFWRPGFFLCKRKAWVLEPCAALVADAGRAQFGWDLPLQEPPALCSRHPVRHISFNSRRLITANVPYEKVVRSADLDDFATHRRSVRCSGLGGVQQRQFI